MTNNRHYRYLNRGGAPRLKSVLIEHVSNAQARNTPTHWISAIRALTQKGVKAREIEESGVVEWLEMSTEGQIARADIIEKLTQLQPTIKEIDLAKSQYKHYALPGYDSYMETMYCLNSEKNNFQDRLDEIRFDLDDLDFNPDRLLKQPMLVFQLDEERRALLARMTTANDFTAHHFSNVVDPSTGHKLHNLIAHSRTTRRGDLFFIDEVQSDWAQKYRFWQKREADPTWRAGTHVSQTAKGPFISNTEAWAGLVLRRLMQRAAEDPNVRQVAWITQALRNGGRAGAGAGDLDKFYLQSLPTLANKALKGTDQKIEFRPVMLQGRGEVQLPGFEMTDKVRERLIQSQPLYSADVVDMGMPSPSIDISVEDMVRDAHEMLGSSVSVRLAMRLLNVATGKEVGGRQLNNLIEVSSRAGSVKKALWHESWHFAQQNLLSSHEAQAVSDAFLDGSPLNSRIRQAMVASGMSPEALAQCNDPREAAAHAFSLWKSGEFHFDVRAAEHVGDTGLDRTVGRVFRKVEKAFESLGRWARRLIGEGPQQANERTAETLFSALASGVLAKRNEQNWLQGNGLDETNFDEEDEQVRDRMRVN